MYQGQAQLDTEKQCPGCRSKCEIDDLQCARGITLHVNRQDNGESELEDDTASYDYGPVMSPEKRLSKVIPLIGKKLKRALSESDSRVVGGILDRHGGFMSLKMLAYHAELTRDELFDALDDLSKNGFVICEHIHPCGESAELTELGRQQAAIWREEYNAACVEFASPLTTDECQQLVSLILKLANN